MLPEAANYEICVKGHLDDRWSVRFEGMNMTRDHDLDGCPVTILSGPVADQAALHGVLAAIRDIGIPVISVNQVRTNQHERGTNR